MGLVRVGLMGSADSQEFCWLQQALEQRGAEVVRVPATGVVSRVRGIGRAGAAEVAVAEARTGVRLEDLDAVVVRSLPGGSLEQVIYRVDVLHRLEKMGVVVINPPACLEKTVDKFYTTALLADEGLPVPLTLVAERYDQAMAALADMGAVVVKPLFGSRGKGVVLLDDPDVAHRVFRALELGRAVYYLQQFVPFAQDFRLFVIGGDVVAAMRRRGTGWKNNIACGAVPEAVEPDPCLVDLAVRAARILQADYLGVDILVAEGQPYVIEANAIPGWAGLQSVSQVDLAGTLAGFICRTARAGRAEAAQAVCRRGS